MKDKQLSDMTKAVNEANGIKAYISMLKKWKKHIDKPYGDHSFQIGLVNSNSGYCDLCRIPGSMKSGLLNLIDKDIQDFETKLEELSYET